MTINATSNRAAVRYVAETTFGVTPTTPALQELRYLSESLNYNISRTQSKEIRSDRNVANLIQTKASSQGDANFELSAKSFDDLIEASLCGTWAITPVTFEDCEDPWNEITDVNVTSTIDTVDFKTGLASVQLAVAVGATTNEVLASEVIPSTDFSEMTGVKLWIKSSVNTALGDLKLLLDDTALCASPLEAISIPALTADVWQEVTLTLANPLTDLAIISVGIKQVTDLGAFTLHIDDVRKIPKYSTLKNGTTLRSFTVQKHFQDITTPVYATFVGQRVGNLSLDFKVGSILTGKFGFMGLTATASTTQIGGATVVAAQTTSPMNAVTDVQSILENGVASTSSFKSLTLNLNNALRPQEAIGSLAPVGIALGTLDISGNIEAYFSDLTMFNRYLNNTTFAVSFKAVDAAGNYYRVTVPAVKLETYKLESGGLDTDIMMSGTWRAIYDATSACMVQIDKWQP